MGHLLVVESWVGAMSALLPRAIRETGSRFTFVTRDLNHYLRSAPSHPHPLLAADNVLTAETNDLDTLLPFLARAHELLGFDGVTTSCDYYLETAARAAHHLGLPGPAPDAVERAYRKDLTRQALPDLGPDFALVSTVEEAVDKAQRLGYPVVVKPVDLCAGMFVRTAGDAGELAEAFRAIEGFPVNARGQQRSPLVLLEEFLAGPEFSVETVTADGATHVVGVTDKSVAGSPWFVESGHMFPADLPEETRAVIVGTAVAAIERLGLDRCVAHTEVKLTEAGPRLVEVNPRPGGNQITELVRRTTGVDLPMVHARLALGETPDLTAVATGAGSAAISFLLPERPGRVAGIGGTDALDGPEVVDWAVKPAGHTAGAATSNNNYLGHVMVVDRGARARARAEELVNGLSVSYA
ncbi:ATP-grasp domain-containing protein [Actinokineospora pegani]|uniref:ATP-grasp domain-containing protein n=1 Tax=Actinokineospora pegani TaxID=2654637 RepID=UPI0012E9B0D6|nr:ATP-grasp domain-containing protein [Actinokineospora pegani]